MARWQLVGAAVVFAVASAACDAGPPEDSLELDDGTELRVVTSDLSLHDEVTVEIEASDQTQAGRPLAAVVATNTGDDLVSVVHPSGPPEDGVLLAERGYDLAWDRGEIEYAEPPTVAGTELAPGATVTLATVEATAPDAERASLRVCLEVVEGPLTWLDDGPDPTGRVMIRGHESPVELACSAAIERPVP